MAILLGNLNLKQIEGRLGVKIPEPFRTENKIKELEERIKKA